MQMDKYVCVSQAKGITNMNTLINQFNQHFHIKLNVYCEADLVIQNMQSKIIS